MPSLRLTILAPAALCLSTVPATAMAFAHAKAGPAIHLTTRPSAYSNVERPSVGWTQNFRIASGSCVLDGTRLVPCHSGVMLPALGSGRHRFTVTEVSAAGVRVSATAWWVTDLRPPSVPAVAGVPTGWSRGAVLTAADSVDTGGSGLRGHQWRTHGASTAWSPAQAGGTVRLLTSGTRWVEFRGVDRAGNVSAWSAQAAGGVEVRIDTAAPTLAPSGGSEAWTSGPVTVVSGASDPVSGVASVEYETSTDGGASWSAPVPGGSVVVSADGSTLVRFQATDVAGNVSGWSVPDAAATADIDTVAPVLAPSGGSTNWSTSPVTIAANASDATSGVASVQYETSTNSGATWSSPQAGDSVQVTSPGVTQVRFEAADQAGNAAGWTTPDAASTAQIQQPLDIMLVIDRTGSMADNNKWQDLIGGLSGGFLPSLDPSQDAVGLGVFPPDSSSASNPCEVATDGQQSQTVIVGRQAITTAAGYLSATADYDILGSLESTYATSMGNLVSTDPLVTDVESCLEPGGGTNYTDALVAAGAELNADDTTGARKVIVFLSDGAASTGQNCNTQPTSEDCMQPCQAGVDEADALKAGGIEIYSVLYGPAAGYGSCDAFTGAVETPTIMPQTAMAEIASPGEFFDDLDPSQVPSLLQNIAADMGAGGAGAGE